MPCSAVGGGDWRVRLYLGALIAAELRAAVAAEAGFRCSAGIAANPLLAKLVSGLHKPNAATALPPPLAEVRAIYLPRRCGM